MKCHTCDKEIIPPNYKVTKDGEFCCSSDCYNKAIGAHLTMPAKDYTLKEVIEMAKEKMPGPLAHDPVNHPAHYTSHPSGVECIQITRHMTFNCGNAVKYLWRNGLKDGAPSVQDLKKAIWYINDEIKRIEEQNKTI